MSTPPFAHLHCHSHFSLLDGASPIEPLVQRAKELGMNSLALTDHGNLHGALQFYKAAKAHGVNPVLGYEAYIAPGARSLREGSQKDSNYHLTLLAKNRTGFKNLIKLASKAYLEGFYFKPRIDKELLEQHHEGIVCLSGCVSGEFSRAILRGQGGEAELEDAKEIARWFHTLFGDRYFIEIQNNGLEIQRMAMEGAVQVARELGLPLVCTSDAHYIKQEDAEAQDVLLCINTGRFRTDTNRMRMEGDQFYLRSPEDMYQSMAGYEEALKQSQLIADGVDIDLELGKRYFPTFTPPEEKTSKDYLYELCIKGLKDRYQGMPERWKGEEGGELSDEVMARLDRELGVINKLGFANYFLIVWDFVVYSRSQNIPATARGSGVGSLVCFALYLSHVCPLKYDLLFERFLDESRLEAPDIDIDFCKERRGDVIQFVKDKYGEANVAQIGTFGTLAARAAIRDVGRALGLPVYRVDSIVAMVPEQLGIKLKDALVTSDELKKAYDNDGEIREVLDLAMKIEGLARNVGTHAAAVVIADEPLDNYVPLARVTGKTEVITQWAMGDVEAAGLLKMDFLGLRNLTILRKAVDLIEAGTGERVDPLKFPLDDKPTYQLLCRGETKGVFQLESGGIRDLLQRMKPDHFRDIIATNALYRPGPLEGGMVDQYIEVKHGRKEAVYPHPVMEDVLAETHGVMVYQEQVMRILNRLGGIPLSSAYSCIKAISKKKLPMIAKFKEDFLKGAGEQGLDKNKALELFEMIEKFAGYGFNKCVVGDTEIIDARTGERATVGELFHNRRPFHIHSLAADGKLRVRPVTDVMWNGRKRVYDLRTAQGKRLRATDNHPLLTLDGWKNLGELRVGDRIAAPRRLDVSTTNDWPRHELIALAGLLSEGNTCHPSCLYFYNNDRSLVDDFVAAAECFPETSARIDQRRGGRYEICVSTGRDTRFQPGEVPWNSAAGGAAAIAAPPATRSGAYRWAEKLGILNRRADEKRIPAEVFRLSNESLELFLGRLWAGDGFLGGAGQSPFYATSSEQLARDVQLLLLRLGILSGVHQKTMRYRYQGEPRERSGFTVHLFGDGTVETFCRRIAPHSLGREQQLARLREHLQSIRARQTSKDTIPAEVRRWVDRERRQAGLTWRELQQRSGVCVKEFYGRGGTAKRGFRRETLSMLAKFFGSSRLEQVAESDIFWDRVASIEPAGVEDTYDLTVADDHNFVADGLVVHNSHSTAYALIAYQTAYLKAHWPAEYMAALLSGDIPGRNFKTKDPLVEHLEDSARMGITVVPPDVNRSREEFFVADGQIEFGLCAIKGCGADAAAAIVAAREKGGRFRDLFDFCERVDPAQCGRAAIESLIKAGAFDSLGARRSQLMNVVERAIQAGAKTIKDKRSGQKGLFDAGDDAGPQEPVAVPLPDVPEWPEKEKLGCEKEVLGYYLTSHPLAEHEKMLGTYCSHRTSALPELPHRTEVMIGGMLSALKFSHTKAPRAGSTHTKYAMFDLEDLDGMVRCIIWPEQFALYGDLVKPDAILVARGKVDRRPGSEETNFIIDELISLEDLESRYTSGVAIRVMEDAHGQQGLEQLHEILRGYPGDKSLRVLLCLADGARVHLDSPTMRVELSPEMRARVDDLLGPGNFRLEVQRPKLQSANDRGRAMAGR